MTSLDLHISLSATVEDSWGRILSFESKNTYTSFSDGCGNVNAIKTHAARRMSIMMMFSRNFAFFKEKSGGDIVHFGR